MKQAQRLTVAPEGLTTAPQKKPNLPQLLRQGMPPWLLETSGYYYLPKGARAAYSYYRSWFMKTALHEY
jgi:hypothetical protein